MVNFVKKKIILLFKKKLKIQGPSLIKKKTKSMEKKNHVIPLHDTSLFIYLFIFLSFFIYLVTNFLKKFHHDTLLCFEFEFEKLF
jgi:hypothetical protein